MFVKLHTYIFVRHVDTVHTHFVLQMVKTFFANSVLQQYCVMFPGSIKAPNSVNISFNIFVFQ